MIQAIEIAEFGVKYKDGNKWLPILLLLAGLFGYIHEKLLPSRVIDRYFMISGESNQYFTGYLGAPFMYAQNRPFYLFVPLLTVLYQMTRFTKLTHLSILFIWNIVSNGIFGKYIVDKRLENY